jgi:hypothetical protein
LADAHDELQSAFDVHVVLLHWNVVQTGHGGGALQTVFARKPPKNEEIRTFAQFAIALGKPMKKE